ncbi:MAG: RNA 2',3'-cyclic phosphodiesterase [Phycisphaerales bacterium]
MTPGSSVGQGIAQAGIRTFRRRRHPQQSSVSGPKTLRLFAAIYPPLETSRALLQSVEGLCEPTMRVVPLEQVHLTVHFVGPARRQELDRIIESLVRAASGIAAFEIRPRRLVALPEQLPRLLAAETSLPAELAELQRRLVTRLASKPSGRAYRPHITVCRFRAGGPTGLEGKELGIPAFAVSEVHLMESVLRQDGAEHRLVERIPLE